MDTVLLPLQKVAFSGLTSIQTQVGKSLQPPSLLTGVEEVLLSGQALGHPKHGVRITQCGSPETQQIYALTIQCLARWQL